MLEFFSIHICQIDIYVSYSFFEFFCLYYWVHSYGQMPSDKTIWAWHDAFNIFFSDFWVIKHVPRFVFLYLIPTVVDKVRTLLYTIILSRTINLLK